MFGFSIWDSFYIFFFANKNLLKSQICGLQVIGTEEGVEHLLGCRVEAVDAEGRSLLLAKECRHVTVQGRIYMGETWVKHGISLGIGRT